MVQGALEILRDRIGQKERELLEKEEDYYRNKRRLEERGVDLANRRRRLSLLLEQEQEKMECLLIRYKAGREEAEGFYRKVQELKDESEWIYKGKSQQLEDEIEELKRFFYHDRDRLERELRDLRRTTYNDRDCSLLFARR